jgi:diguanylate cyclase (GGDEF)-like protein/putative nucleotidyltransferase with HDIG domain
VTFTDITERKQKEERIHYLSCHDTLTGLFNRRCFEDNRLIIDSPENLPLSVIFADINGLKLTNDIFGHAAGDELIKKSAEILLQSCRENDVIARVGGDEFIILLPRTDRSNAKKILSRISSGFQSARVSAVKCSISLGLDTKKSASQSIEEVIANAENAMYKDKTINRQSVNRDIIDTLVETLHSRSEREKRHSIAVSELCAEIGTALNMPESEINKLRRVGYLHDIGKVILEEDILTKSDLTTHDVEKMQQHSVIGYRILNLFDDTLDLAEYVYSHHERWDGGGYPRGLKGEQIPVITRILSVAETYERVLNRGDRPVAERRKTAADTIMEGAVTQFDPEIAAFFIRRLSEA